MLASTQDRPWMTEASLISRVFSNWWSQAGETLAGVISRNMQMGFPTWPGLPHSVVAGFPGWAWSQVEAIVPLSPRL